MYLDLDKYLEIYSEGSNTKKGVNFFLDVKTRSVTACLTQSSFTFL